MVTAIDVKGLTHRYGRVTALSNVTMQVAEGSLYALLGPNGSGKTTFLKILMGLLRPSAGDARVFGKAIDQLNFDERAQISYVAEGLKLPGWMTLLQLEAYVAPLHKSWDFDLAASLRRRFKLDARRKIKTLSRGQHMKAAVLCALAPRPRLLIMDEPFTGMDVIAKDDLVRGMLEIVGNERWTVVISSHDIAELESLADWVGFLDSGRLTVSEPIESLYARFKRVEVMTSNAAISLPRPLPREWLSVERSGQRLSFLLSEDASANSDALHAWLPDSQNVDVRPASLREIFIALAEQRTRNEVVL